MWSLQSHPKSHTAQYVKRHEARGAVADCAQVGDKVKPGEGGVGSG